MIRNMLQRSEVIEQFGVHPLEFTDIIGNFFVFSVNDHNKNYLEELSIKKMKYINIRY